MSTKGEQSINYKMIYICIYIYMHASQQCLNNSGVSNYSFQYAVFCCATVFVRHVEAVSAQDVCYEDLATVNHLCLFVCLFVCQMHYIFGLKP